MKTLIAEYSKQIHYSRVSLCITMRGKSDCSFLLSRTVVSALFLRGIRDFRAEKTQSFGENGGDEMRRCDRRNREIHQKTQKDSRSRRVLCVIRRRLLVLVLQLACPISMQQSLSLPCINRRGKTPHSNHLVSAQSPLLKN